MYCAAAAETALREVLADLRPNSMAIAAFVEAFGEGARDDVPAASVTAAWRRCNVLIPVHLDLQGPIVDLTDHEILGVLERRHAALLAAEGMPHLDLHEVTTRLRSVTRAIAADVYDRLGAAAVRFPSSRDGQPCFAVFEGRGRLVAAADTIHLTDPAPEPLRVVAAAWRLALELAPATQCSSVSSRARSASSTTPSPKP
jgi:hypothetical protein